MISIPVFPRRRPRKDELLTAGPASVSAGGENNKKKIKKQFNNNVSRNFVHKFFFFLFCFSQADCAAISRRYTNCQWRAKDGNCDGIIL